MNDGIVKLKAFGKVGLRKFVGDFKLLAHFQVQYHNLLSKLDSFQSSHQGFYPLEHVQVIEYFKARKYDLEFGLFHFVFKLGLHFLSKGFELVLFKLVFHMYEHSLSFIIIVNFL